jgi:hypothetical protein
MRLAKALPLAFAAGLTLAACARSAVVGAGAPPPPPPPDDAAMAVPAPTPPPAGKEAGAIVLKGPEGTQWVKPGVSEKRYRADVDSCLSYAQAQIAHDERIERDSAAAFDTFPSGLGTTELRSGMSRFERTNRRSSLFNDCMVAKGYAKS